MTYDFEITFELNELDIRTYLRDSADLFQKDESKKKRTSFRDGYNTICTFIEYGYPSEWKRIMQNLWVYWEVKSFKVFLSKLDRLTQKDKEQMIEEIVKSEISAILLQK